jgi:hypothetical protein
VQNEPRTTRVSQQRSRVYLFVPRINFMTRE